MKLQSKVILNSLIENFIKYGFIANGAMNLKKEPFLYVKELLNLNLIMKRNCKLPHIYELSEDIRNKLIEKYDLDTLWGIRKDEHQYNIAKYSGRPKINIF